MKVNGKVWKQPTTDLSSKEYHEMIAEIRAEYERLDTVLESDPDNQNLWDKVKRLDALEQELLTLEENAREIEQEALRIKPGQIKVLYVWVHPDYQYYGFRKQNNEFIKRLAETPNCALVQVPYSEGRDLEPNELARQLLGERFIVHPRLFLNLKDPVQLAMLRRKLKTDAVDKAVVYGKDIYQCAQAQAQRHGLENIAGEVFH
ncbi:hypothetical protein KY328_05640, partial [Candidatus Woesearchaeota archaeon]|nr:hypothetical protein [Candidatus Woesearchaeota archaeon]